MSVYCIAEKPKLQPFHFPQGRTRVGESASALCALVAGSPVVRFKWFKENVAIDGKLPNVNVKNDKMVSVLTIESVTLSSAGNYTCIADNDYGSDANSAALVVEGRLIPKLLYLESYIICYSNDDVLIPNSSVLYMFSSFEVVLYDMPTPFIDRT